MRVTKRFVGWVSLFLCLFLAVPPVHATDSAVSYVEVPATSPLFMTAIKTSSTGLDYVEIYNEASLPQMLTGAKMVVSGKDVHGVESVCSVSFGEASLWLRPKGYGVLASTGAVNDASGNALTFSGCDMANVVKAELTVGETVRDMVAMENASAGTSWVRKGLTATYRKGDFFSDFEPIVLGYVKRPALYSGGWYAGPPTDTQGLRIVELLPAAKDCAPSDTDWACGDYVKLQNTSSQPIALSDYRVRAGNKTTSPSVTNTFHWQQTQPPELAPRLILPPDAYYTLRLRDDGKFLSLTDSGGWVWLEDAYGARQYANSEVAYGSATTVDKNGAALAYRTETASWQWTTEPNPYDGPSIFTGFVDNERLVAASSLVPCRDDQYRSETTNRCRNISTTAGLTPCKEGQYRSEETNRCRSIASAVVASLTPCAPGQERNAATNRCRKINSVDGELAPCKEGQERNPATNRCRNAAATSLPPAAFAAVPIADTGKAFVGWWALGGLGILALGYGAWEWRAEILTAIRKIGSWFISVVKR